MTNSRGEKRGEKTGEISPLHLKYIFVWFTLITMKKFWQNIYDEIMKIHEGRKRVRKRVRSNHLPDILVKYKKMKKMTLFHYITVIFWRSEE